MKIQRERLMQVGLALKTNENIYDKLCGFGIFGEANVLLALA